MNFECDTCNYSTQYKCNLLKHTNSYTHKRMVNNHTLPGQQHDKDRSKCNICNKSFSSKSALNEHNKLNRCKITDIVKIVKDNYTEDEVHMIVAKLQFVQEKELLNDIKKRTNKLIKENKEFINFIIKNNPANNDISVDKYIGNGLVDNYIN